MQDEFWSNFFCSRIWKNNGDMTFTQSYFYPFYGAMKTMAADFDKDGDLDIAAVSFFPDWTADTPQTFVYLENRGGTFSPSRLEDTVWGRWLVLDIGDVNSDGYPDIVLGLGSASQGIPEAKLDTYNKRFDTMPSVVLLLNTGG